MLFTHMLYLFVLLVMFNSIFMLFRAFGLLCRRILGQGVTGPSLVFLRQVFSRSAQRNRLLW